MRTAQRIARWLGLEAERINISQTLQKIAESLRRPYIDYIGKLGEERESVGWWFSSLSEKNPGISRTFPYICYVAVALQLCRQHEKSGSLVLIVENRDIRRTVAGALREQGIQFIAPPEPCIASVIGAVSDWSEMFARKAWGISRQLYRMIVARALGFSAGVFNGGDDASTRSWVLLHNWVNAQSTDAVGRYQDVFFGALREELQRRGVSVAVVVSILSKAPYVRLLIKLKKSGIPVLVPHAALTLGDVLRWGWSLLTLPPQPHVWPRFEGMEVSDILNANERMDWKQTRVGDAFLILDVVRKWHSRLAPRAFIYTYEGHTWERGYCLAIREHFPESRLIGYQHSTHSPMWLSHFISRAEWGKVPFPDRVVTNGRYHYEMLRENGIPEQWLSCGGALRYSTLRSNPLVSSNGKSDQSVIRVLAAFSIFPTQAAELLLAVSEAFSDSHRFQVLLKFHPLLPAVHAAAESGCTLRTLPAHMQVMNKPLSELLSEIDVLVYTDTTAAVEALACSVPVVHLKSNHTIDMDRLGYLEGARISVSTAEEMRITVERVLKPSFDDSAVRVRRWCEVVDLLLPKPDDKTIDLFMPEGLRENRSRTEQAAAYVR